MYPRTNYEMTQADMDRILEACKPVPYMVIGGHAPSSQQENANRAWAELGSRMGFDPMTVQPISGKDMRHFSAVANETESQRVERLAREAEAARQQEILQLQGEIAERKARLSALTSAERSAS